MNFFTILIATALFGMSTPTIQSNQQQPVVVASRSMDWSCVCDLYSDRTNKKVGTWRTTVSGTEGVFAQEEAWVLSNFMCERNTTHVDCDCDCKLIN